MFAPPPNVVQPPFEGTRVEQLASPTVAEYRILYNGVGEVYQWTDRNRMPDDELLRIISDEAVEIDVLFVNAQRAGYAELDRREPCQVKLAYFGLFPEFVGKGLGKYFLSWTLARAWSFKPTRVWVHTCDLDHAAAVPNYLQAGFAIYDERMLEQIVT
jgi:GNAT superfamily N-acetyltransferase